MKKLFGLLCPLLWFAQPGLSQTNAAQQGEIPIENGTGYNTTLINPNIIGGTFSSNLAPTVLSAPVQGIDNAVVLQNVLNGFPTNQGFLQTIAISNLPAIDYSQAGGGWVQLGRGVYPCGTGLAINGGFLSSITIEGSAYGGTVILLTNAANAPLLFETAHGVTGGTNSMEDHTFYHWKNITFAYVGSPSNDLININGSYSLFEGCVFANYFMFTNGGFWPGYNPPTPELTRLVRIGGTGDNRKIFLGCMFMGGAQGIDSKSDHLLIDSCDFFSNGTYGQGAHKVFTNGIGTVFSESIPAAIFIESSSLGDIEVRSSHFFGPSIGYADISGTVGPRVHDNLFEGIHCGLAYLNQGGQFYAVRCRDNLGATYGLINFAASAYSLVTGTNSNFAVTEGDPNSSQWQPAFGNSALAPYVDYSLEQYVNVTPEFFTGILFGGVDSTHGNASNPRAYWPPVPAYPGQVCLVGSNGSAWVLTSGGNASTWQSTNKLAGP